MKNKDTESISLVFRGTAYTPNVIADESNDLVIHVNGQKVIGTSKKQSDTMSLIYEIPFCKN